MSQKPWNNHHVFTSNWNNTRIGKEVRSHGGFQVPMFLDPHRELHYELNEAFDPVCKYVRYGQLPSPIKGVRGTIRDTLQGINDIDVITNIETMAGALESIRGNRYSSETIENAAQIAGGLILQRDLIVDGIYTDKAA